MGFQFVKPFGKQAGAIRGFISRDKFAAVLETAALNEADSTMRATKPGRRGTTSIIFNGNLCVTIFQW